MAKLGDVEWQSGNAPQDVIDDLQRFLSAFDTELENQAERLTDLGVQFAKADAPVDTGELKSKIRGEVEKMQQVVVARILAEAEHSIFPEFGTIYQEAQPYMRPALRKLEPMVVKHVQKAWDDAIDAI